MKIVILAIGFLSSVAFAQNREVIGQYPVGISAPTNYVSNPSCFHNKNGITATGGTITRNTTSPLNASFGADCKWAPTAVGQVLTIQLKAFDPVLKNQNCMATLPTNGVSAYTVQANRAGAAVSAVYLVGSAPVVLNFPCGDPTNATTLTITSTIASPVPIQWTGASAGAAQNIGLSSADTTWQDAGPITFTGSSGNPTKGTVSSDHFFWKRSGPNMDVMLDYAATTGSSSGSGTYYVNLPTSTGCSINAAAWAR